MIKEIKSVAIYKPTEISVFEVGRTLMLGDKKQDGVIVQKIKINIFKTVSVKFSNGMTLYFKGLSISYEV